jgi:RHS repeat-associated protein
MVFLILIGAMPPVVKGQVNRPDARTGNPNARPDADYDRREARPTGVIPFERLNVETAPVTPTESEAARRNRVARLDFPMLDSTVGEIASAGRAAAIGPRVLAIPVGEKLTLTGLPRDAQGEIVQGIPITWTSGNSTVVQVNNDGTARAVAEGEASIVGQAGAATLSLTVRVTPPRPRPQPRNPRAAVGQKDVPRRAPAVLKKSPARGDRKLLARKASVVNDPPFEEQLTFPTNIIGAPPGKTVASSSTPGVGGDCVETGGTKNFTFSLPITGLPGRGVSAGVALTYNSNIWSKTTFLGATQMNYDADASWPAPGFEIGFGTLIDGSDSVSFNSASGRRMFNLVSGSPNTYLASDGSWAKYVRRNYNQTPGGTMRMTDGTVIEFGASNTFWKTYPTQIRDRNGNYINIVYVNGQGPKIAQITDTLNRHIVFNYNGSGQLVSIVAPGYNNGASRTEMTFTYGTHTFPSGSPTLFDGSIEMYGGIGSITVLTRVEQRGRQHDFTYSPYGMIRRISVNEWQPNNTYQNNVRETEYNYPTAALALSEQPGYSTRSDRWWGKANPSAWVTTQFGKRTEFVSGVGTFLVTSVTQPDGIVIESWQYDPESYPGNWVAGLVRENRVVAGGVTRSKVVTDWGQSNGYTVPTRVWSTNEANETKSVEYLYGDYNNVITVKEYGFSGELLRSTQTSYKTDYAYISERYLLRLPASVSIYTPPQPTSVLLARTDYEYDQNSSLTSYQSIPMWSNPDTFPGGYPYRGNVTSVKQYPNTSTFADPVVNTMKYDTVGNVVEMTAGCCQLKTVGYSSTYGYAYPTSQTRGNTGQLSSSATYDLNTGFLRTATDENNQVTTYDYSADYLIPTQVTAPNGFRTQYGYYQPYINAPLVSGDTRMLTFTDVAVEVTPNLFVMSRTYRDAAGRPVRSSSYTGAVDGWVTTEVAYDAAGRPEKSSNPFRLASHDQSYPVALDWTTTTYDNQSRVIKVKTPDNAETNIVYNGRSTKVLDAKGRRRESIVNVFGQLAEVWEDRAETGNTSGLNYQTLYTYDLLGNLVRIQQGAQNRYFKYDAMSRPTHARHPEQSASISAADSVTGNNNWSSATTYDIQGRVATTTDAKGVVTTMTYDGLNRVTQITYTDGTPTKRFKYGDDTSDSANLPPTNANMKGRLWRAETDSTDGEKRVRTQINNYDNVGRVTSLTQQYRNSGNTAWGDAYTTLRTYGLTQLTGEEYPSNRTVSYSYDAVGRWTEVKGKLGTGGSTDTIYSDSVLYDVWGGITRERLGYNQSIGNNGVWVNERRNIRGQAYDKRAGKEHQEFGWNRGCWQNYFSGQNETWGGSGTDNTGQVMKTQSHIPEEYIGGNSNDWASRARMFRMAMEYDSLGRLKRASEIAASYNTDASWGESWTTHWAQGNLYDRYGNRTIDPNATQTFNAVNTKKYTVEETTNRLLVPSGETGTMTYDAMGQLIKDTYTRSGMGNGERTYDADGRMISAQVNGSNQTENAIYDAGGKRVLVKNPGGTSSTRFVYGIDGELVAEYASSNFAAGSPTVEYAYRGGEVIVEARSSGNTWRITDSLGSVRTTLDANGNLVNRTDHAPFGEELGVGVSGRTGTTGTRPMFFGGTAPKQKFTGLERDEKTSYDHTLWRKMDSTQGRWTSPDPYAGSMRVTNPQSLNRYAYVENDPGNFVDPSGLQILRVLVDGIQVPEESWAFYFEQWRNGFVNIIPNSFAEYLNKTPSFIDKDGNRRVSSTEELFHRFAANELQRLNDALRQLPNSVLARIVVKEPILPKGTSEADRQIIFDSFYGAVERVISNPNCAGVFGGANKALGALGQTEYRLLKLANPKAGAQTNPNSDGSLPKRSVFLNSTVFPTANGQNFSFLSRTLSPSESKEIILLHELGHQVGKFGPDYKQGPGGSNLLGNTNQTHTGAVFNNCF